VALGPEYREPILAWLASIIGLMIIGVMVFVFILVLVALIV
jgi:hypothetical protein